MTKRTLGWLGRSSSALIVRIVAVRPALVPGLRCWATGEWTVTVSSCESEGEDVQEHAGQGNGAVAWPAVQNVDDLSGLFCLFRALRRSG